MWLYAKSIDGNKTIRLGDVSRTCEVSNFRKMLVDDFDAPIERLGLFFRGKQLVDGVTLFHYGINVNDTILVHVMPILEKPIKGNTKPEVDEAASSSSDTDMSDKENDEVGAAGAKVPSNDETSVNQSIYYMVGDRVDIWDPDYGGWVEATIRKIVQSRPLPLTDATVVREDELDLIDEHCRVVQDADDGYAYYVHRDGYEDTDLVDVGFDKLRPRAHYKLGIAHVNVGDWVMVNYNVEKEAAVGVWYRAVITGKDDARRNKSLRADVHVALDDVPLIDRKLAIIDHVYRLVSPVPIEHRNTNYAKWMTTKARARPACLHCSDLVTVKCKICSCGVCGGKEEPDKQPVCEECGCCFHIWCLKPSLDEVPTDDEWYCPNCKNDETEVVRRGEGLKESKKKAKMPSMAKKCNRDWGKGMACVRRTKRCTLVPADHFGQIPGVEVGTMWRYRVQASEAGVHRPIVAGIHGRAKQGAFSLVISGGYEEDEDLGEVFTYTGSGGRNLTGNKRTAKQTSDQCLTLTNKALALNCAVDFNEEGAVAADLREGKPIRVVRSYGANSQYSPEEGLRYDGIYKVKRYWPEVGNAGFIVWRYELRRCDDVPAPWTKDGMKRIQKLGLIMQNPDGYEEKLREAEEKKKNKKGGVVQDRKRRKADEDKVLIKAPKRAKSVIYRVPANIKVKIDRDVENERIWKEVMQKVGGGYQVFIDEVKEQFACICCQDLPQKPVMTPCKHIFCKACLDRSFKLALNVCPTCRYDLGNGDTVKGNKHLTDALNLLFPGYSV